MRACARVSFFRTAAIVVALACAGFAVPAGAQEAAPNSTTDDAKLAALTLADAIQMAVANGEAAKIAEANTEAARLTVRESEAGAYPQVTGIVGYTYNINQPKQEMEFAEAFNPLMQAMGLPPMENPEIPLVYRHDWAMTLDVQQTLAVGRVSKAIRLAKMYEETNRLGANVTNRDTALETAQAYYDVVLAEEFLKVSQMFLTLSQNHHDDTKRKYEAGLKSEFDLLQAQADLAAAAPNVTDMKQRVVLAKKNLLRLIGMPLDREVTCAESFSDQTVEVTPDAWRNEAFAERDELRMLSLGRQMKRTESNLYYSNMLPAFSAHMAYTYAGQSITEENEFWPVEDDWNTFWSVGVQMQWPIFDGLGNWQRGRRARVEERIAALNAARAEKGIDLEIESVATTLRTAAEKLAARREAMEVADRAFNLASVRYENGLGTALEKMDAKAVWTQARVAYLQTLYELNVARYQLAHALGKETW